MKALTIEERSHFRKVARARRKSISNQIRKKHALDLRKNIQNLPAFINSKRIALYIPNDGEIDPTGIISVGEKMGKFFYLPILAPKFNQFQSRALWFGRFSPQRSRLIVNKFNIPEPFLHSNQDKVTSQALDLILLPLVCFDTAGNRLGMGGGYYDRTLARHYRSHPKCIGVAFEVQKFDAIPTCSWDIPLDGIITEKCFYPAPRNGTR